MQISQIQLVVMSTCILKFDIYNGLTLHNALTATYHARLNAAIFVDFPDFIALTWAPFTNMF